MFVVLNHGNFLSHRESQLRCEFNNGILDLPKGRTGARPTNDISMEFEIQCDYVMLFFITYSTDYNEFFHTSQQCLSMPE